MLGETSAIFRRIPALKSLDQKLLPVLAVVSGAGMGVIIQRRKNVSCGRRMEDRMASMYYWYGVQVGKYPWYFLIAPLILTCILFPGIFRVKINLDLYKLFVPPDAPVKTEFERTQQYNGLPQNYIEPARLLADDVMTDEEVPHLPQPLALSPNYPMYNDMVRLYALTKDDGNILVPEKLGLLYNLSLGMLDNNFMFNNQKYNYTDFCVKDKDNPMKCNNLPNIWLLHAELLFKDPNHRSNPNLQFSYPVMYLFQRPKDIGNVIYGVNVTGETHEIVGAKVVTMHTFISFPQSPHLWSAYPAFRDSLYAYWKSKEAETGLRFVPHNERAMDDELRAVIVTAVPYAIPSTILMMLFVVFSNISADGPKSKPIEALLSVVSVWLSLFCTFGLLFFLGVAFNPVASTMPFLILAIGVDDAFLLLGAWRVTDERLPNEKRLGLAMAEAGTSITITTLTDFWGFGLGYVFIGSPAVQDFCLLTAVGVAFDFLFQTTFYVACVALGGRRDKEGGLLCCVRWWKKKPVKSVELDKQPGSQLAIEAGEKREEEEEKPKDALLHKFMRDQYAPAINRPMVKLISFAVYFVYLIVGILGCTIIDVDISPKKYVRDNSPIQEFVAVADKYVWADNVMPTFFVMRPPDFRDEQLRTRFNELVYRLEHTEYSIGRVSTTLWLWRYQQFLTDFRGVDSVTDFYDRTLLREFFDSFEYQEFRPQVKFHLTQNITNKEPCIRAFTFQTSYYGLNSWDKRTAALLEWRSLLSQYPEFDVFLSNIFSPFLIDQRTQIAPAAMQNFGSAIIAMFFIAVIFIPDVESVFYVILTLMSISMGVCGLLAHMGSDLDSVSLVCITMSIGFAVDFSAHVCYRYHRSEYITPGAKLRDTLESVGWPLLQAATSTMLAVVPLPLVPAYLVRVFFQTVIIVCIVGLLHGLLWLPQLMAMCDMKRTPLRELHQRTLVQS